MVKAEPKSITKLESLRHIASLKPNQSIVDKWLPVAYRAEGSRYGACGIRIDGTPEFIDAVLSRLKDVLELESEATRLELARRTVDTVEVNQSKKEFRNKEAGAEVCYIRCHMRGPRKRTVGY